MKNIFCGIVLPLQAYALFIYYFYSWDMDHIILGWLFLIVSELNTIRKEINKEKDT